MSKSTVLRASKIHKGYLQGAQKISVLDGLDFEVNAKDRVAVVGRSGSGKSTLLHILAGLDAIDSGTVEVMGSDLTSIDSDERAAVRLREMGFVYQAHHLLPEFSAVENVAMPLRLKGIASEKATARAAEILREIGLEDRCNHRPDQLSGGERQRVAVARAICPSPKIILADEPTGNLDVDSAVMVMDLLARLAEEKAIALVVVTHDMSLLGKFKRVYELAGGVLKEKLSEP